MIKDMEQACMSIQKDIFIKGSGKMANKHGIGLLIRDDYYIGQFKNGCKNLQYQNITFT